MELFGRREPNLLRFIVNSFRPLQIAARTCASKIDVATYEGMMTYSILATAFEKVFSIPTFENRERLWDECMKQVGGNTKITYVEFGVYGGYSIKQFAQRNSNGESVFIGLDSFEGLPEDWGRYLLKGAFNDVKGIIPTTDDTRISFIKGWFQDTWEELNERLANRDTLVVNFDADLYSSTLFALAKIDSLKRSYIAIFDEFVNHEVRALYNYCQAFNASVAFIAKTDVSDYPMQVMCRITPRSS